MVEMIRFGDFASFKYGKMPNKKKITESGAYPVYSGYRYVGFYDEYNTEANQLIIVARGVGGTGDVKLTKERCYLTNLAIAVDIDTDVAVPEYLYYYFLPRNLRYLDSGSAQSQITISDLERVILPLPSIAEQKRICSYLKLLDEKIKNNEEINKNLAA
jgi:type I restriction enzyme, S subunit